MVTAVAIYKKTDLLYHQDLLREIWKDLKGKRDWGIYQSGWLDGPMVLVIEQMTSQSVNNLSRFSKTFKAFKV